MNKMEQILFENICKTLLILIFSSINTGVPCEVVEFDKTFITNTKLVCKTPPQINPATEYIGNRGVNMIVDNVLTSAANLESAQPSASAQNTFGDAVYYLSTSNSSRTVWFKGFFVPGKTSAYELTLDTNGDAILLFSENSTSAIKVSFRSQLSFILQVV